MKGIIENKELKSAVAVSCFIWEIPQLRYEMSAAIL